MHLTKLIFLCMNHTIELLFYIFFLLNFCESLTRRDLIACELRRSEIINKSDDYGFQDTFLIPVQLKLLTRRTIGAHGSKQNCILFKTCHSKCAFVCCSQASGVGRLVEV